jgi:hypothetical protein
LSVAVAHERRRDEFVKRARLFLYKLLRAAPV